MCVTHKEQDQNPLFDIYTSIRENWKSEKRCILKKVQPTIASNSEITGTRLVKMLIYLYTSV